MSIDSSRSRSPSPASSQQTFESEEERRDIQVQRDRERSSRRKRQDKMKNMRAQVTVLEQLVLVLRLGPDEDASWDEFLDEDTKRLQGNLRRLAPANEEMKRLLDEKAQLERKIAEHEQAREAVQGVVDADEADDWEADMEIWKALAKLHFRPLDIGESATYIDAALLAMQTSVDTHDRETTGLTFMGWRVRRRPDTASSAIHFCLDKIYQSHNMDHHINMMWRVYTEPELYARYVLGGRSRVSVDILQQISPTICVVRYATAYDNLAVTIHELYLLFRIDTADGVVICLKSIDQSDLKRAINESTDMWTSGNFWVKWEVLDSRQSRSSTDYRISFRGTLEGDHPAYMSRWLPVLEVLAAAVRSDVIMADRPMLEF